MIRDFRDFPEEHFIKADTFKNQSNEPWTARPLHSSIVGRNHAIELDHPDRGKHYLQCDNQGHVERWLADFHSRKNPDRDNKRRHATQLELWVSEAKGLPTKQRRYYAELCLDDDIYARTSSKEIEEKPNQILNGSIVWGEYFEFPFLPDKKIKDIRLHIYRDTEKKKSRKDKDYIGLVNIPISSLSSGQFTEKWFPLATPKRSEGSSVRMKARYQLLQILPMELYKPFAEYLSNNYLCVSQIIGPSMTAGQKERVAGSMVRLMLATGKYKDYLTDLMELEVKRLGTEQEALLFRENSIGSKSIECFLKLVCRTYLHESLQKVVKDVIENAEEIDCEVDKERIQNGSILKDNQDQLLRTAFNAITRLKEQKTFFPNELREVYVSWRERVSQWSREDLIDRLVAGSLFLRLLCPALLTPSLFNLASSLPSDRSSRTLTLTAKIVQSMANGARFGAKEDYLAYLNRLLDEQREDYKKFVTDITNRVLVLKPGFEGHVDLGLELAKLQQVLDAVLSNNEDFRRNEDLVELRHVVQNVNHEMENSNLPVHQKQSSKVNSLSRKEQLAYQNATFQHVGLNNNDIVGIHGHFGKSNEHKKLFDDLEESNNYLQESIGYPRSQKGYFTLGKPWWFENNYLDMTREWLLNHNIDDASEIISYNNELEHQIGHIKNEKDELSILNESLNEKCDLLISQNNKLKSQLHEREEQCNVVLDRLLTIEKELNSDRQTMQQTIDSKQRLIEQQTLRIQQLEHEYEKLNLKHSHT